MIRIGIAGIGGRMGREVFAVARADPGITVVGGLVRPGNCDQLDLGLPLFDDPAALLPEIEVLLDFTAPDASLTFARACTVVGRGLVCGTTGLSAGQFAELQDLSSRTAIFYARNMSVGVAALLAALPGLVRALDGFDIEIVKAHHRHKADAPSGTALAIVETIVGVNDHSMGERLVYGRHGLASRKPYEIGIHSLRGGGNAGEHTVVLASEGEELRVSHRACGRRAFALGAVQAARFLAGKSAGLYTMERLVGTGGSA